ncbi:hypothetical protein EDD21DRAFT_449207, partial [Dissophora ornata]
KILGRLTATRLIFGTATSFFFFFLKSLSITQTNTPTVEKHKKTHNVGQG